MFKTVKIMFLRCVFQIQEKNMIKPTRAELKCDANVLYVPVSGTLYLCSAAQ